jgi:methylenetetrahydrofolate reductase (NADPH)
MPHFTCIGSNSTSILDFLKIVENLGIENIMALRGDPPKDQQNYNFSQNQFPYASALAKFIKDHTSLAMAVAGYPEKHPEAITLKEDIQHLQEKVTAGASAIITQLFFDNQYYFDFVKEARNIGISVPIIPGILPVTSLSQIDKASALSNAKVPEKFYQQMAAAKDNEAEQKKIGINHALGQIQDLITAKVPGIHFYTLNKAEATAQIIEKLF